MDNEYLLQMLEQAKAFATEGRLDLALNICNVALDLLPSDADKARARVLLMRGQIAYRLSNHHGALDDLQKAIALDSTLADQLSGEFSKFYRESGSCH